MIPGTRYLGAFLLLLATGTAAAWEKLTDNLDLSCSQDNKLEIDCTYRLLKPGTLLSITARHDRKEVPVINKRQYPGNDGTTAVMLLVDTSDPARQPVIEQNKEQIRRILEQTTARHRVGLASFDKALEVKAPVGSNMNDIIAAADTLEATGLTTELYRNTIKAIELLAKVNADRRVIFLFSDGQAEDKAYFHQDVVQAARRNNVVINSLGFQRTLPLSVALQTLRRLSEETGGVYVEADKNRQLPRSFLDQPFANIDRGGSFTVDLEPLSSLAADRVSIDLAFSTDTGRINTGMPAALPGSPSAGTVGNPASTQASSQAVPPIQIVTSPSEEEADSIDTWLWYGVPFILLVLVLLTVFTLLLLIRKIPGKQTRQLQPEQFKPYAYLISQDEKATRYPITRTTWRIGRSRDNELTLDDNSVSRRHAEIQRLASGKFMIYDHSSLNGVFINGEKVTKQKLEESDIIEIGDFFLRFTESPSDYQLEEDTVLQRTRAPSIE